MFCSHFVGIKDLVQWKTTINSKANPWSLSFKNIWSCCKFIQNYWSRDHSFSLIDACYIYSLGFKLKQLIVLREDWRFSVHPLQVLFILKEFLRKKCLVFHGVKKKLSRFYRFYSELFLKLHPNVLLSYEFIVSFETFIRCSQQNIFLRRLRFFHVHGFF